MRAAPILLLLTLLLTACSTQVTGMQAPVMHDHGGVAWRPLVEPVTQPFIVAPAYTAVIENDPDTTPGQLIERIGELPEDTRDSTLDAIRVSVRPVEGATADEETVLEIWTGVAFDPATGGYSLDGATLARETPVSTAMDGDETARVSDPPPGGPGSVMALRLVPGTGESGSWEFAVTPYRHPYGGWPARGASGELDGALAFETVFMQPTDTSGIAADALDRLSERFFGDPLLLVVYGVVACLAAGGLLAALWRPGRER